MTRPLGISPTPRMGFQLREGGFYRATEAVQRGLPIRIGTQLLGEYRGGESVVALFRLNTFNKDNR